MDGWDGEVQYAICAGKLNNEGGKPASIKSLVHCAVKAKRKVFSFIMEEFGH